MFFTHPPTLVVPAVSCSELAMSLLPERFDRVGIVLLYEYPGKKIQ